MGSGYVVEHCVSVFRKRQEEKAYKNYVTESLMAVALNTSRGEHVMTMNQRFAELMEWIDVDKRSGDEIAEDIIRRAGLKVKQ